MKLREVIDFDLENIKDFQGLLKAMESGGGFSAKSLGEAYDVLKIMLMRKDCLRILSFVGSIISTGVRGIIKEFVKRRWFDLIITTTGALDHDLSRSFSSYYHGSFDLNDKELYKKGYHRLGNILIPKESYGKLIEDKILSLLKDAYSKNIGSFSCYKFCWEIGKMINKESSFLYWAYKNNIPVIVPGFYDGAIGNIVWLFSQTKKDFRIDIIEDENLLSEKFFESKKRGALIIGGGISKHHTLWWSQFKGGLDYGVYITTSSEYDGSLSGARLKEAISWGKVGLKAKQVTISGEATLILPILSLGLFKIIKE